MTRVQTTFPLSNSTAQLDHLRFGYVKLYSAPCIFVYICHEWRTLGKISSGIWMGFEPGLHDQGANNVSTECTVQSSSLV